MLHYIGSKEAITKGNTYVIYHTRLACCMYFYYYFDFPFFFSSPLIIIVTEAVLEYGYDAFSSRFLIHCNHCHYHNPNPKKKKIVTDGWADGRENK